MGVALETFNKVTPGLGDSNLQAVLEVEALVLFNLQIKYLLIAIWQPNNLISQVTTEDWLT